MMKTVYRGDPDEIQTAIEETEQWLQENPPEDEYDIHLRKLETLRGHLAESTEYLRIREQILEEKNDILKEAGSILGKNNFITSSKQDITYHGKIVAVTENYAVQEVLEAKGILHTLDDNPVLKAALEAGKDQDISISYDKNGHAAVGEKHIDGMEIEEQDNEY